MYKMFVLAALLAVAAAAPSPLYGAPVLGSPYGYGAPVLGAPWGHGLGAPLLSAPVVKAAVPVATSYANTIKVASPVAYAAAPAYAAPAYAAHAYAAPAYAHAYGAPAVHAPLLAPGLAHGW